MKTRSAKPIVYNCDDDCFDLDTEIERYNEYRRAVVLQGAVKSPMLLGVPAAVRVVLPNTAANRVAVAAIAAKQRVSITRPSTIIRITK